MKKANISTVKAELSKYIRLAREGEEVIIMDRDQPVAKIVAVHPTPQVRIRAPQHDLKAFLEKMDKQSFDQKTNILDVLKQDREDRFP